MLIDIGRGPLDVSFEPPGEGAVDRTPLVFLHQGLGSIALWRTFPADVRTATGSPATLVYSRHGYGHSTVVRDPRPVSFMHDEADIVLPQVLARFEIDRPVLVGHSDGASIALLYAGAGQPVAGLVLIAPHVFVEDETLAGIVAARDAFATTDLRDRMARHHADVDATFRGWSDAWLSPAFRSWDITDRLPAITSPVLLVQGDADEFGTLAQLDAIEHGVQGATERVIVAGAGHSPHVDAPGATLAAVSAFVRSVEPAEE